MSVCQELLPCHACDKYNACSDDQAGHGQWLLAQRLGQIKHRVLVMSNKGGVGKSTVAAHLAAALAADGHRVGLLDADLCGPSAPHLLGLTGARLPATPLGVEPAQSPVGVKVASLAFLLENETDPVLWRDSVKHEILGELAGGVNWGVLDWLLIDMPPGTGGEFLALADLAGPFTGAVIVTTPQELALQDVRRAISGLKDTQIPVLGIVENMSGLVCPHCQGEIHPFHQGGAAALAAETGIPILGSIPLEPALSASTPGPNTESAAGAALRAAAMALVGRVYALSDTDHRTNGRPVA